MTIESSANYFAYASLVCSLSFWLGLILSYLSNAPRLNFMGVQWFAVLGVGIVLAVVAAVLNFEKKLWILGVALGFGTSLFVMYVIGS